MARRHNSSIAHGAEYNEELIDPAKTRLKLRTRVDTYNSVEGVLKDH